jgi:two-component system sensor histidine kinase/response regulator
MSSGALRLLLVEADPHEAERISCVLANANHSVLPATNFQEASEALDLQRFDAVLLGRPARADDMTEFTSKLRALENSQRSSGRTPVLSFASQTGDHSSSVDGYLPEPFEPASLTNLLRAVSGNQLGATATACPDLPVLEAEGFLDQVAYDRNLMVEIIDLFFAEREHQLPEMEQALATEQYERLQRIAHTIKGSLGSLHATRARWYAQSLETAAKDRKPAECRQHLTAFQQELERLDPELLALRNSPEAL